MRYAHTSSTAWRIRADSAEMRRVKHSEEASSASLLILVLFLPREFDLVCMVRTVLPATPTSTSTTIRSQIIFTDQFTNLFRIIPPCVPLWHASRARGRCTARQGVDTRYRAKHFFHGLVYNYSQIFQSFLCKFESVVSCGYA